MLTVYKASAGSGKTFQLVVEYLKLQLQTHFSGNLYQQGHQRNEKQDTGAAL